ncbi:MAG: zinc protease [Cytophagales bacterium]|jgi:predicted Zn-dependent peptidase|nr:insulinase family protein [Bacteroidota bacterium]MBS1979697.1 insulinase family protein [Bacteroidota bacterium]WHZ06952.1 MAG: zinc protease [Cytophagales bacterium]
MKTITKNILTALLISVFAIQLFAQKETPPAGGTPKDFHLPAKTGKTLANGLRSTLVQYGVLPKVNVNLIIKTGNVHEAANEVWLADLTSALMKEGTATMNFKTISKKVAGMGGEVNINTGADNVTISGAVLSEFAPDLIKVIADIVMNPAFPASEVERLKSDLKRQLVVQKSVPQSQASEKFFQMIYKDHPYGRTFPTEEMLSSYTLDMAKGFYNKNFGAKRSVVYVVGKFDEQAVTKAIEEAFTKWTAGPEVSYPPATPVYTNEIAMIDRKDAPQTTVILGTPTLTPKDKDVVALQVTNSLLGGSFGSRITSNIREDKGYTYSPFSTIQNRKGVSVWYEEADVTSKDTGASLQEIAKEIKRLQSEAPPKAELEGIQRYMAGTFVLQNSNPNGIINQLNFLDLHGMDDSYLTDRVKNIYAVTPEKVSQMTKDYFKYEDMTLVLVGDKKLLERQIKMHEAAKKLK